MVQEQRVSFSEKDNGFRDVFPKSKEDASRELKNRELVGLCRFPKNHGIAKYVSENQMATGRLLTPIVYGNTTKPNFPIGDDSVDEMNEWKNGIKLHACDSMDGHIFNNRSHWNMRCKFLEVRLRINGMDKIRENPDQIYAKPEGKFFIYVPIRRNKNDKKRNEEAKMNGARPADYAKKCSQKSRKPKICLKVQNVIPSGNTGKNIFTHQNKMNKDCAKEAKTDGSKSYDCETNGSQGDSTKEKQSIKSNYCCPNEKDGVSPDNAENDIEDVEMKSKIFQEKQHSRSETCSRQIDDELVLEDVSDADLVLPEVVFASPQRLIRSPEYAGAEEISRALSVRQRDVFENNRLHPAAIDGSEAEVRVSLSKLERLRRRITSFFGRFRRNRVTSVDI